MRFEQSYTAKARYHPDYMSGLHRLYLAVLCRVEDLESPVYALLDTASEWCVLPPGVAVDVGVAPEIGAGAVGLQTRFGELAGRLERLRLRFTADEGETLEL